MVEPNNFNETKDQLVWCVAIKEEVQILEKNETWTLVSLSNGKKLVRYKWIFKIKYHSKKTQDRIYSKKFYLNL
jgi:hypothetical protein